MILGLDTASVAGNKNPDWQKARAAGFSFAIIRANWGTTIDKVFSRDWDKIKAAGMTRGAYMFLRSDKKAATPEVQAETFIKAVGKLDLTDFPPVLDVEYGGNGRSDTGLTVAQCLDRIHRAYEVLSKYYNANPIIYTSARVWLDDLNNTNAPSLASSPLWLAQYVVGNSKPPLMTPSNIKNPPVPPPWAGDDKPNTVLSPRRKILYTSSNWWIHQFQGNAIKAPGFPTGNVDINRFNVMLKGEQGTRVKWAQRNLGMLRINGIFDNTMDKAVRAFQETYGLVSDGIIGPRTFAIMAWEFNSSLSIANN